ncbi:latent transforming growth factor beta-binding protein [Sorangium cellulosum]|uniref:Latent transforming growth factor beta-binding protein n=1 Tax=Sorangium cellulosum TaxID=56 RepID=A0A2L0ETB9_SORCE|nr:latent transforming growth factor beta-binding protein [Sorangium cellulosum]AUX42558.1 latent transforming growth factor beta-binding protein [Sorangium cellulosum]
MRIRHVMITFAVASLFAACASSEGGGGGDEPTYATVCLARCACEECSADDEERCQDEQDAIEDTAEQERCDDELLAYNECVRLEGRCVNGHHVAEVCNVQAAALAGCLRPDESCPTAGDGVCDEAQGTGLCPTGTDPADCLSYCPYTGNGKCDGPEGSGLCPPGTDVDDCKLPPCEYTEDGTCDEPEGTDRCVEGTDVVDCAAVLCETQNNDVCDEPEGTDRCPEGTDVADCAARTCSRTNNGVCDEPEGTDLCDEGTDVADCSGAASCDAPDVSCDACNECANEAGCADELDACIIDDFCALFVECMASCGDNDACLEDCAAAYPSGSDLYADYATCVMCDECYVSCGGALSC